MDYVDSAPYLCCTDETFANISNARWGSCPTSLWNHLNTVVVSLLTIANNAYAGLPYEALYAYLTDL